MQRYRVLVIGEGDAGKTSLVNYLTGGMVTGMRVVAPTVIDWYNVDHKIAGKIP